MTSETSSSTNGDRKGEREEEEKGTRLCNSSPLRGGLFLAGLVWLHLICFGQTILDCCVVASAGRAKPRGP